MVGAFRLFRNDADAILPPVGSADVTPWVEDIPDGEPQELSVEIRLDQVRAHVTEAVERSTTLSWNEELIMYVRSHV
jgi:hypothetical protein